MYGKYIFCLNIEIENYLHYPSIPKYRAKHTKLTDYLDIGEALETQLRNNYRIWLETKHSYNSLNIAIKGDFKGDIDILWFVSELRDLARLTDTDWEGDFTYYLKDRYIIFYAEDHFEGKIDGKDDWIA